MSKKDELEALKAAVEEEAVVEVAEEKPVAKRRGPKLTEKVAVKPVYFSGTTGRVYAHDGKVDRLGATIQAPLIVDFGEGVGEEAQLTGGLSRPFFPDLDECERIDGDGNVGSYCSCKHCLKVVRDYIARDKYGICAQFKVREEDPNPPTKPYAGFDTAHPDDIEGAVKIGAISDLENAVKWEIAHMNRAPILAKLDELAALPEEPADVDILAAEVVV